MNNQHKILKRYHPPKKEIWSGRNDGPDAKRFHQVIEFRDIRTLPELKKYSFALLGFCCDVGVKRNLGNPGAAAGPRMLRQALANLPFPQSCERSIVDCGDIVCEDDNLEEAQECLSEAVAFLLKQGATPVILGGGHEIAWGHYQGIVKAFPDRTCSIVNFDAHFDLRPLIGGTLGSSGTSFLQIAELLKAGNKPFQYSCFGIQTTGNTSALFKTAEDLKVQSILAEQFFTEGAEFIRCALNEIIEKNPMIYLTVCLDVFASPYAPGVSARQPLGLIPWQVLPLIKLLAASGHVVSFDVAELCPERDWDNATATLGASLIHRFIASYLIKNIC